MVAHLVVRSVASLVVKMVASKAEYLADLMAATTVASLVEHLAAC